MNRRYLLLLAIWTGLATYELYHVFTTPSPEFAALLVAWSGGIFSTLLIIETYNYLRHRVIEVNQ